LKWSINNFWSSTLNFEPCSDCVSHPLSLPFTAYDKGLYLKAPAIHIFKLPSSTPIHSFKKGEKPFLPRDV
jgi:hypothetical protein